VRLLRLVLLRGPVGERRGPVPLWELRSPWVVQQVLPLWVFPLLVRVLAELEPVLPQVFQQALPVVPVQVLLGLARVLRAQVLVLVVQEQVPEQVLQPQVQVLLGLERAQVLQVPGPPVVVLWVPEQVLQPEVQVLPQVFQRVLVVALPVLVEPVRAPQGRLLLSSTTHQPQTAWIWHPVERPVVEPLVPVPPQELEPVLPQREPARVSQELAPQELEQALAPPVRALRAEVLPRPLPVPQQQGLVSAPPWRPSIFLVPVGPWPRPQRPAARPSWPSSRPQSPWRLHHPLVARPPPSRWEAAPSDALTSAPVP
jgi:hypothetical protein